MPKEKNYNPVQAAKKAEKAKQLKKAKAQLQTQRTEKLARRNPARLQRDIDELKQLEESGEIRPHDRQRLAQLQKDLAAVQKARETLGDKAPQFGRGERRDGDNERTGHGSGRGGGVLGKRRRDGKPAGRWDPDESSETDEDVQDIPMPRDTPPPIPRRERNQNRGNPNETPMGEPRVHIEPKKPVLVYEAAPQVRDLRKEATRFVPTAIRQKMQLAKGQVEGRLLEPEEYDELEQKGYILGSKPAAEAETRGQIIQTKGTEDQEIDMDADEADFLKELEQTDKETAHIAREAVEAATQEAQYRMMEAEAKGEVLDAQAAERKLHLVEVEEVEDEGEAY
ncbi:hypothetical protein GQ43DRAFT_442293 [Delitschia confertaspora ATCC 74209]|uniref:Wbp11/ELF5/Saf1 N-terminal domain-containing protein n=1 Tax=Delitschia confertaspora ATCC 74209 TaxID=1513339 RepID=A0A9P4JMT0_9PLEO|nr:hypothetical protein GQ43DRAFT_442293 [Delitschia confertaspora ATCC 74209]